MARGDGAALAAGGRRPPGMEKGEHPVTGRHRYPGWPFRMTPGPSRHHRLPPPTLGQHNQDILRGIGLTDDAVDDLRAQDIVGESALNA